MAKKPYIVHVTGEDAPRMIDAASPAAAIAHVFRDKVKVSAATGREVRAWTGPIEVAGEKPVAQPELRGDIPKFLQKDT